MHKSKENANSSFSIGKTWNLDDLTHISSYTGPQVDPNHHDWAGDVGFLVSLGKSYYWQARTDKEKKFFLASLIKIYGKYTGGKVPELTGFEQKEYDQVVGAGRRGGVGANRPPPPQLPPQNHQHPPLPNQPPSMSTSPAPPPSIGGIADAPRFRTPPVRPSPHGASSPATSFDSSASRERPPHPRWMAQNNRSQDSFGARSEDTTSIPPRSRNGVPGPGAFPRPVETPEARTPTGHAPTPPPAQIYVPPPPPPPQQEQAPPERRRPPMDPSRPQDRDLVPPPLISPGTKKEIVAPPPRSVARKDSISQQTPSITVAGNLRERERDRQTPPPPARLPSEAPVTEVVEQPNLLQTASTTSLPVSKASSPAPTADGSPVQTPGPPPEPEDSRPGLGPMIKSKRSKGDLAGTLWRAANTAAAFKPRPGGAGERLRQAAAAAAAAEKEEKEGPDGITSVIPAPPRPPSRGKRDETPERPKSSGRSSVVPEVKITVPKTSRPNSVQAVVPEVPKEPTQEPKPEVKPEAKPEAEPEQSKEPAKEEARPSASAGNDAKYLQSLGIDANILDERSQEFGKWLDYFGWIPGDQMRNRNVEEMKFDLDRELNKAQAGGWLARFREEDERVDGIKRGIDIAITECEELDNLLTLYSVELSVGSPLIL